MFQIDSTVTSTLVRKTECSTEGSKVRLQRLEMRIVFVTLA